MSGTHDIYIVNCQCLRFQVGYFWQMYHMSDVHAVHTCNGTVIYLKKRFFEWIISSWYLGGFASHQNVLQARYTVNVCIPISRIFLTDVHMSDVQAVHTCNGTRTVIYLKKVLRVKNLILAGLPVTKMSPKCLVSKIYRTVYCQCLHSGQVDIFGRCPSFGCTMSWCFSPTVLLNRRLVV
jgi:hypothetical protein